MIKSIFKVGLLLVVGILGYNYFFGTADEKAQAKEIINKGVDVGKASVGLLKGEINKFKSGKYDDALDKVGGVLKKTKERVKDGGEMLKKIEDWEAKKDNWLSKKKDLEKEMSGRDDEATEEQADLMKQLNEEAEKLEKEGKELKDKAADE